MPDVFLSYSHEDQPTARRFAEGLEREGFSVWWDQALTAGEAFDRVTEKALADAKAVVVLWSRASVESDWVRAEATQARTRGTFVPVAIEPCDRPILFELTHTADLSGWNGDAFDTRWRSLVAGIGRSVGGSAIQPAAQPLKPAAAASAPRETRPAWRRPLGWATAAAVLIAAGLFWLQMGRQPATAGAGQVGIAVLPFDDMSPGKDQGHFADGMAEEILNALARIPDPALKVIARNSSFSYRGQNRDLRDIGRELDVAHLLEGSVRRDGDQLRVTAQLIDTTTNAHLWSQQYDRPLADVFVIQQDIATKVAEALQVALGVGIGQTPGMTRDVAAYELFLEANAIPLTFTSEPEMRRVELLRQAVRRDPSFALAWRRLSEVYVGMFQNTGEQTWLPQSDAAFAQFARLMPDAPDVHMRQGFISAGQGRLSEAEGHFIEAGRAAERLYGPGGAEEGAINARMQGLGQGRVRQALPAFQQAKARDPLNQTTSAFLAWAHATLGDYPAAFTEFERADRLAPTDPFRVRITAVTSALGARDRQQLLRWVDAAIELETQFGAGGGFATELKRLLDQPAEARAWLLRGTLDPATPPLALGGMAHAQAYFGDHEAALETLRRGLQPAGVLTTSFVMWAPGLAEVRKLPGFKDLMREFGFVDVWKQFGWPDEQLCRPVGDDDFECG